MIPGTTWAAGIAGVVLLALLGLQTVRLANEKASHANDLAMFAQAQKEAAEITLAAEQAQREREAKLEKEKTDAINKAQSEALAAKDALARSSRAADSLRKSTDALVARARQACQNPAIGIGSATADDPIGVLADVLGRADKRAGILAEYADSARRAGQTCERQYDSLILH